MRILIAIMHEIIDAPVRCSESGDENIFFKGKLPLER
jgi:hypothetical protein